LIFYFDIRNSLFDAAELVAGYGSAFQNKELKKTGLCMAGFLILIYQGRGAGRVVRSAESPRRFNLKSAIRNLQSKID
jgi:hypothetical protein